MTLSFESLLSIKSKLTADGVKMKRGLTFGLEFDIGSFSVSFDWKMKDTKINTGYSNVKTSSRLDNI